VADNDLALGRILEYLSGTKWWKEMAVFVTEDDAQGGVDHIDAHRTVLLCAGPWFKKNYVSHVNTSFPGLLKTIFRLLGVPPLNLFDAVASDLADCFASRPDTARYQALPVDKRIFRPRHRPRIAQRAARAADGRSAGSAEVRGEGSAPFHLHPFPPRLPLPEYN